MRLVRTGEDYANWALEILVKFRDAEDLQVLTAQRQSGGVSLDVCKIGPGRRLTITFSGTIFHNNHVLNEFDGTVPCAVFPR